MNSKTSPKALRQLEDYETEWLKNHYTFISKLNNLVIAVVIVFLIITIFAFLKSGINMLGIVIVGGEAVVALLLWINNNNTKQKYMGDIEDSVYKLTGSVSKHRHFGPNDDRTLKVGNVNFDFPYATDFTFLSKFYDSVKEGSTVIVEYSPKTKHIWKIYNS